MKTAIARVGAFFFALLASARPDDIVITNGDDSGSGSLRDAVTLAAVTTGPDVISFAPANFPAGGTVNLTASLTIPAAGDTGGVTLATAVSGGNVDVAVNTGTLSFGPRNEWTGAGRILLGATSGSANATVEINDFNGAGTTLTAPIVVCAGSTGVKTLRSSNTQNINVYSGNIRLEAPLTVEKTHSLCAFDITGDVNVGPHLLTASSAGAWEGPSLYFSGRVFRDDPGTDPARMKLVSYGSLFGYPVLVLRGAGDNTRLSLEAGDRGELYLHKISSPGVHALGRGLAPGTVALSSHMIGRCDGGDQIADTASVSCGGSAYTTTGPKSFKFIGDETVDELTGGGYLTNSGRLTVGAAGGSGDFGGNFSDPGSLFGGIDLSKVGGGIQTLSGDSSYSYHDPKSGTMTVWSQVSLTVSGGILNVTGAYRDGKGATVASGAALAGTGSVHHIVLGSGGILAPGDARVPGSIGTLNVMGPGPAWGVPGNLTWNGGGTVRFEFAGSSADKVAIEGQFIKGSAGTYTFNFQSTGSAGQTYTLATFAGTNFTAADFSATNLAAGVSGSFAMNATSLTFTTSDFVGLVTTTADSGPGSLRQVLTNAAAHPGTETIGFAPSLSGQTITLHSEIVIPDGEVMSIDAGSLPGGLTISGGGMSRLLFISISAEASFAGLTFTGGGNGFGGAIVNDEGTLTMSSCTFSGNTAGRAIYNDGLLTMTRCTLSGNAVTGDGGAIFNEYGAGLILRHCTLSGNSAGGKGGAIYYKEGSVTLTNCVVSGNTASDAGPDLFQSNGSITAGGVNFIGNPADSGLMAGPAVLTGNALLAPLDNYGGSTKTMALQPGSPARNAAAGSPIVSDQRGFPIVGVPDIGAYEAGTIGTSYNAFAWESLPAGTAAKQHAARADFDSDGQTNGDEFLFLTDPASSASFFQPVTLSDTAGLGISFPTVSGRNYRLRQSDDFSTWIDAPSQPALPGDGSVRMFTVPQSAGRTFYKIVPFVP